MKYITAPDFPTGGNLILGDGLRQAYETGKGTITMVAKMHKEEAEYGKTNIVITERPYQVSKSALLTNILDLRNTKKGDLLGITNIVDESDRNGMRAIITVGKNSNPDKIIQILLKSTKLKSNFNINMVAIADGKPKQLGLLEIISYYVEYQRNIILRRSQYDYDQAKERAHILEGLVIALHNIDEVIKIIKTSNTTADAKANLRNRFELSDKQAQAILDMRLAKLAKLEVTKIEEELKELQKLMAKLLKIIKSKKLQMDVVASELTELGKAYKTARRSSIQDKKGGEFEVDKFKLQEEKEPVVERKGVFILDTNGKIKLIPTRSFSMGQKEKNLEKDNFIKDALTLNNESNYYAITNLGNMARIDLDKMPLLSYKDEGVDLLKVEGDANPKEKVVRVLAVKEADLEKEIYIFSTEGLVKRSKFSDLVLKKSYGDIMTLKDKEEIFDVQFVEDETTIFFGTKDGMCLNIEVSDIPVQGRKAGGVKCIKLNEGDKIIEINQISDEGEMIVITDEGFAKRVFAWELEPSQRYRKGLKIIDLGKKNGNEVKFYGYVKYPYDLVLDLDGYLEKNFVVNSDNIMILARTNKGKQIIPKNATVLGVRKLFDESEN